MSCLGSSAEVINVINYRVGHNQLLISSKGDQFVFIFYPRPDIQGNAFFTVEKTKKSGMVGP